MVDNEEIKIIENFLTQEEIEKINLAINSKGWRYGWASPELFNHPAVWHIFIAGSERIKKKNCEEELSISATWGFLHDIWQRIKTTTSIREDLLGVYANAHTAGQDSLIHRDIKKNETGKTALLFVSPSWFSAWAGETVFYDEAQCDIIKSVLPKPGSLVVFNAKIPHNVRAPSSFSRILRTSIAFKTELTNV